MIVTSFGESSNLVSKSKMFVKDEAKVRAEWEVSSEELCILASWFLSPMSKNSVLELADASDVNKDLTFKAKDRTFEGLIKP